MIFSIRSLVACHLKYLAEFMLIYVYFMCSEPLEVTREWIRKYIIQEHSVMNSHIRTWFYASYQFIYLYRQEKDFMNAKFIALDVALS